MRRAVPLSVQLLITFVGLLVGMAAVLTTAAYTSLVANLERDAQRNVALLAGAREQAVTQLFQLRQQRAEGFLASLESLCGEPLHSGRLAWADECVRTMVDDFRTGERAVAALVTHGRRRLRRSGDPITPTAPPAGALADVIRSGEAIEYVMQARRGDTLLTLRFAHDDVARLFEEQAGIGRDGEVLLVEGSGALLTRTRHPAAGLPISAEFLSRCHAGAESFVDLDYRGVRSFQSLHPVAALGAGCVVARLGYEAALAPAERLREALVRRAIWFVLVGATLSLVAAQWISAPVRRLAQSARALQKGRFDRPIPLSGPSEVRALGRAFNAMGNDLAEMVAREQAARREAEAANRLKDEFLATVSHELRTPLTAILGWAQMLRGEQMASERQQHGVAVIERSARAQARLIDDLLDVSRIVAGRLQIAWEPVRMAEVVQAAVDAVAPLASEKPVSIETVLDDSAAVIGDHRRLEQIVWNLVWNAVKFTLPSGRVVVKLERSGGQVVLSVTDTGVGISSAFLPHVFEWFRQEDARSRSQSGLGLGLGIVRHLVQVHGGSVEAESRGLGHGATFTVTLPPFDATGVALPVVAAATSAARRLDATRILVVEDDEATRELVRTALENAGATVEAVATASDARREMLADAPDLLISDIRMPEEDGYDLIKSLRGAGIATPAIALTAFARPQDAQEARRAGFQLHVPKPVDTGMLIDAVASLVGGQAVY